MEMNFERERFFTFFRTKPIGVCFLTGS